MKIYHTSPAKIEEINNDGMFGDCLFFSGNIYEMGYATHIYSLTINDEDIIDVNSFFYSKDCYLLDSIIEDIVDYMDGRITKDTAMELLDSTLEAFDLHDACDADLDYEFLGELSWYIQAKQGEAAKTMGYTAAEARDEQGTVYIVPMLGRESDLVLFRASNV